MSKPRLSEAQRRYLKQVANGYNAAPVTWPTLRSLIHHGYLAPGGVGLTQKGEEYVATLTPDPLPAANPQEDETDAR